LRTQRVSGRTCLLPVEHARVDGNATQRVLHPFAPLTRQDAIK
jgi:hypothetical protein